MKTEKKFFSLNNQEYTIVKGKRWYVEYYIERFPGVRIRKRESGQMNRQKDLEIREQKAIALIEKISSRNKGTRSLTSLEKVLEDNIASYKRKTYLSIKSRLKYYMIWLGDKPQLSVTVDDVNAFLLYLLSFLSSSTVESYKWSLSGLYKKIDKKNNPFEDSIPIRSSYTSLMYFNDEQIRKILQWARKKNYQLYIAIKMIYYCFIRPGEMRVLKVTDINLDHGYIEVRKEISKNKKTQKVIIPNHFKSELKAYIQSLPNQTGFVFPKTKRFRNPFNKKLTGCVPWGLNWFNNQHTKCLKELKIWGRYAFYSWKHTGVVKAVKAGINLKDLQLQLRHHSLDQVNEYLKDLGVLDSEGLRYKFPKI